MKIEILDAMMGSGKTTAIINWINKHPEKRYIYISPLLSEVGEGGRVQQESKHVKFCCPSDADGSKSEDLLLLLQSGENIACTHSLYRKMTHEHLDVISKVGYTLIIDEELGVIEGFSDYAQTDIQWLIQMGVLSICESDGKIVWCEQKADETMEESHKYARLKNMCDVEMLYAAKRTNAMITTQLPTRLIDVCERVIVLTYMFKGNVLDCFLRLKGFDVVEFTEVNDDLRKVDGDLIRSLITITPIPKKFTLCNKLSSTWYDKASSADLKKVENAIRSIAVSWGVSGENLMYTFPKDRSIKSDKRTVKIKPRGFIEVKQKIDGVTITKPLWLASSIRATNDYAHVNHCIHAYRRYPLTAVDSYLKDYGYPINVSVFALSELLQWVWRTSIRNEEPIKVCILSDYMLELFQEWLQSL